MILARAYSPADYGLFEMYMTILGFTTIISGMGLFSGYLRFISYYKTINKDSYIAGFEKFSFLLQLGMSIIMGLIIFTFANKITFFLEFRPVFKKMLKLLSFIIIFKTINRSFGYLFIAYKRNLIAKSGSQIIENLLMILGILLMHFFNLNIFYITIVFFGALLVETIFYFKYYLKVRVLVDKCKYDFKHWSRYCFPLLFDGLLAFILSWTDNIIIGKFLNETLLGYYGVAYSFAFYIFFVTQLFSPMMMPILTEFFEKDKDSFGSLFTRVRIWAFSFSLILGLIFVFSSEAIVRILFGKQFINAALPLSILAIFFTLSSYFDFSRHILNLNDRTKNIALMELFVVIVNIILSVLLIEPYGISGVAFSSGFSFFLFRLLLHLQSKRYYKYNNNILSFFKIIFVILASFFLSLLAANIISRYFRMNDFFVLFLLGLFYCLFLIFLSKINHIFCKDDLIFIEVIEKYTKFDLKWLKQWMIN